MTAGNGYVLVTDGGGAQSRDCVAAVRDLHRGGYRCAVTVSRRSSRIGRSRYVARVVEIPPAEDPDFAGSIREELGRHPYVTVIPAAERALLSLQPDLAGLVDKVALRANATRVGLEVPPQQSLPTARALRACAGNFEYPVVVKPALRTFNAFRADSPQDLELLPEDTGRLVIQPYLSGTRTAVGGLIWRGRLIGAVHERWLRIWPPDCGLASAAITTAADPDIEARLTDLLIDYDGIFWAQFVGGRLIDLNLRVCSTHALATRAGVNLAAMYCDLVRGETVAPRRAAPGAFFRWLEGDVRNAFSQWRAGSTGIVGAAAFLKPRRRSAHSIESIGDPGPLLARLSDSAGRLRRRAGSRKPR